MAIGADGFTPDMVLPAAAPPEVSVEVPPDVLPALLPDIPAAGPPIELVVLDMPDPLLPLLPDVLPLDMLPVVAAPLLEVPLAVDESVELVLPGAVVLGELEDVVGTIG